MLSETIVLAFLGLSLLAYVVFGGADFGVGVLELFTPKAQIASMRKAGEHAIAPVWEANHVWVIIALVILFVGFPEVHVRIATYLHIPLLLMLVGIIIRGTAFTFRYYDVGDDRPAERLWSALFCFGSVLVPLTFGHLAASLSRGRLPLEGSGFFQSYILPWIGWFPLSVGFFTVNLFAWLAAVFLVGESTGEKKNQARTRATYCSALFVVTSAVVAIAAWVEQVPWFVRSLDSPFGYACGAFGLVSCAVAWRLLSTNAVWTPRIFAGATVTCVLGGYWGLSYPVALDLRGRSITWHDAAAESATLDALATTLIAGSLLIIPSLIWLYRLFKRANLSETRQ